MSRAEDRIAALERELTQARETAYRMTERAGRAETAEREARRFAEGLARDLEALRAGAIRAEVESPGPPPGEAGTAHPDAVRDLCNRVPWLEPSTARAAIVAVGGSVNRAEALVFVIRRERADR